MSLERGFSGTGDRTKVAILGDESTINGFKLTGINGPDTTQKTTMGPIEYLQAISETMEDKEVLKLFRTLAERKEVAMILLTHEVAERIRENLTRRSEILPVVMEIPGKNTKPGEDRIMKRLKDLIKR